MSIVIRCYANDDDTFVAWSMDNQIEDLRGFALIRERDGIEEIVTTWVGFSGGRSKTGDHRPSTEWPIQKFQWTDYLSRTGDRVRYRAVPMTGSAGALERRDELASDWSDAITIGAHADHARVSSYYNRGIVAAQWLSRRLEGDEDDLKAKGQSLTKIIGTVGDKVRGYLGGSLRARLLELLRDAAENRRRIYAVLYELDDPELLAALEALGKRANVVLANGSVKKKGLDQNRKAASHIRSSIHLYRRMLSPRALGHNKFLVLCDGRGRPAEVWTGSTNWTKSGLCTQANNGLLIRQPKVAAEYVKQWQRLKRARSATPESLVAANDRPRKFKIGETHLTVWFTPTSEEQDLEEARGLINGARKGILFLMFNPGPAGSLLNAIVERGSPASPSYAPDLYIQGAVNQDPSTKKSVVHLFHRGGHEAAPFDVVLPAAVGERLAYWIPELKKKPGAFAMVHSKVIVIDPFSENPAVLTGSHNLGPKASGKNDENLVIIRNDPALAAAYAVNIMSIYNQYRWRFKTLRDEGAPEWEGLADDSEWQAGYLRGAKRAEMRFWVGR